MTTFFEKNFPHLAEARELREEFRIHRGGEWCAWSRMMQENSFTHDPAEPRLDFLDAEKSGIYEAFKAAMRTAIDAGEISLHDAKREGYPWWDN